MIEKEAFPKFWAKNLESNIFVNTFSYFYVLVSSSLLSLLFFCLCCLHLCISVNSSQSSSLLSLCRVCLHCCYLCYPCFFCLHCCCPHCLCLGDIVFILSVFIALGSLSEKKYGIFWEFFPYRGGGLLNPKTFVI